MKRNTIKKTVGDVAKSNWKRKSVIYGSNFIAGFLGNKFNYNIGNPVGAIVYGGLDLMRSAFPKLRESKYVRLAETAGALGYAISGVRDLVGILEGDLNCLAQLPFDAGMLYETARNAKEDYKHSKANLKDDLIGVKDDVTNAVYFLRDLVDEGYSFEKKTSNKKSKGVGLTKGERAVLYIDPQAWRDFSKEDKIKYLEGRRNDLIKFGSTSEGVEERVNKDLIVLDKLYNKVKIHEED